VRNAVTSNPIQGASVEARLNSQTAFTAQTQADGSYQISLLPGDYTVTFSALDYLTISQGVTVLTNQTTSLNANLQPCVTVKQANFTFSPQWPTVGQTVTFTGTVGTGDPPISFAWDFGDGGSGSGAVVTHAYSGRGGFPAKLTADNACATPVIVYRPVFVEAEMIFLPLVSKE
jgi:PKD repeat protein